MAGTCRQFGQLMTFDTDSVDGFDTDNGKLGVSFFHQSHACENSKVKDIACDLGYQHLHVHRRLTRFGNIVRLLVMRMKMNVGVVGVSLTHFFQQSLHVFETCCALPS